MRPPAGKEARARAGVSQPVGAEKEAGEGDLGRVLL